MTAHPHRPGIDASGAGNDARPFSDVGEYVDHADHVDDHADVSFSAVDRDLAHTDDRFDLFDDSNGSFNRYGSLDPATGLAHRAVTPQLLTGLTGLDLPLCRAFHCAWFGLLEDIGDFDGLIATSEFFASADERRMPAADRWLFEHPAPAPDDGSRPAREVVDAHSLALATAMETNPSLTFGSTTSLADVLLDGVLDIVEPDRVVFDGQIEALTSGTLRLVSYLRNVTTIVGGVRVWATTDNNDAASGQVNRTGDRTSVCFQRFDVVR